MTQWDKERVLLRKEASSGMYSLRAWFCAKTLTVTPIQVAQTAVSGRSWLRAMHWGCWTEVKDALAASSVFNRALLAT